ncbi:S1 family serine peptidase [Photobacterium sanguinicancri]|uniref:Serine protease n=1 Tax=Photobacterium sanguinicancri TaxID=875932 RepID=A0AAW7Y8S3_9GAMM|nr:serine protease [Photobacterium sanguinicancri]MDO6543733.1 serine protease [Photobacterium sanguinicancri]
MARYIVLLLLCFASLPVFASSPTVSPRIIGGVTSQNDELPWQVYLNISFTDGTYVCGGVLVAQDVVLTAAHCLQNGGLTANAADIKVWAGISSVFSASSRNVLSVSRRTINNSYNASRFSNDIAVLRLATPAPDSAKPILIANQDQIDRANTEFQTSYTQGGNNPANLLVSGWGSTSVNGSSGSSDLQQTLLTGVPDNTCNNQWGSGVTSGEANIFVCAISPSPLVVRDSCFGDSGGPLVWQDPLRASDSDFGLRLLGLVSFGDGCASSLPGVYTEVVSFTAWINTVTGNRLSSVGTPKLSVNPFARDYSNAGTDIAVPSVDSVTGSDSGGGSLGIVVLLSLLGLAVRRTLTLV